MLEWIFGTSLSGILGSLEKKVALLEQHNQKKLLEAGNHSDLIVQAHQAKTAALQEAGRAYQVAANIKALIGS